MQDHLDTKESKVFAAVAHPGLAASNLQATTAESGPGSPSGILSILMRSAQSAEDGAMPLITCICSPDVKARSLL